MADAPTVAQVRDALAAALYAATGTTVYSNVPANPSAPCAVLVPGAPWLGWSGFDTGRRVVVGLDLVTLAAPQDNAGTLDLLETMTADLAAALDAFPGVIIGDTSPPALLEVGALELLAVITPFRIHTRHPETEVTP